MMEKPQEKTDSERRAVTVLFADVSGFTAMSERLEAEEVTDLMNACFEAIGAVASEHGGKVDKYIGDCAMLVFGAPEAVERAPEQALRAALAIRVAVDGVNARLCPPVPVSVHIGVNTGTVVAGDVGASDSRAYTVMGDPVNVASRLKDLASKGQILVGHDTWSQARRAFEFGEPRLVELKGKAQPVEARELLAASLTWQTPGCAEGEDLSPLTGRDGELRALELRALQTEEGQGSIVMIAGEPGIGKSRLVAELLRSRAARACLCLEGRCQSAGRTLPYHPLVDLLRKWASIGEEDDEAQALSRLEAAIAGAAPAESAELFPFVARLMGYAPSGPGAAALEGITGEALENLISHSVRRLFGALARSRPLLFVVEDLHWADDSTLDLLESLLALADSSPVCFILTLRPDFSATGERARRYARERHGNRLKELDLAPLGQDEAGRLLDGLLAGGKRLPESLRTRILEKADGNPYFIEEVLRSLEEEGALSSGSAEDAAAKLEEWHVPETIQEVLMARIDRLDEMTRNLVRIASVIGRSFPYRVLAEVAASIDELERKIRHLIDIQLLLKGERLDELEYLFKHALAQEVAYNSIVAGRRRELHRAVSEAIERVFPDRMGEFAGMLAWHCVRAEDFERAERYLVMAGEEATKSAASSEALALYRQAFDLYLKKKGESAELEKVAMFEKNIARALYFLAIFEEALPHYDKALAYSARNLARAPKSGDLPMGLGLLRIILWLYLPAKKARAPLTDAEREYVELAYEKAQMLGKLNGFEWARFSVPLVAYLLRHELHGFSVGISLVISASTLFSYGGISLSLCRRYIERASRLSEGCGSFVGVHSALSQVFYNLHQGNWKHRSIAMDPAVAGEARRGSLFFASNSCFFDALGFIELGDWPSYRQDMALLESLVQRFNYGDAQYVLALTESQRLFKIRDARKSQAKCAEYLAMMVPLGEEREGVPNMLAFSARSALLRGDLEEAKSLMARVAELEPGPKGSPMREGWIRGPIVAIAIEELRRATQAGAPASALRRKAAREAHAFLANSRKKASDRTEALKFMGSVAWLSGRQRQALAWWRRSLAEGERLGARVELAHAYHDAGELLGARAPGPEWIEAAKIIYSELGIDQDN